MGVIQSIFCSITFCVERVLTWTCCAFLLIMLMFTLVVLMVYGISVGYHYAQKELASFSMSTRTTTEEALYGEGSGRRSGPDTRPVVRLLALNTTNEEHPPKPMIEMYQTRQPQEHIYLDTSETPIILLETERSPSQSELLSSSEKELAKNLIGRYRRSKNVTEIPFLRPLKNSRSNSIGTSDVSLLRHLNFSNYGKIYSS